MATPRDVQHAAEDRKGKAKEVVGRAIGDDQLEASGQGDQAAASVKQAKDKVTDAAARVAGRASESVTEAAHKVGDAADRKKDERN